MDPGDSSSLGEASVRFKKEDEDGGEEADSNPYSKEMFEIPKAAIKRDCPWTDMDQFQFLLVCFREDDHKGQSKKYTQKTAIVIGEDIERNRWDCCEQHPE